MPVAVIRGREMGLLGRLAILLVAASCSDGTGLSTDGTLALTVAPATINLAAGASGTATVTIARGGGFLGAVTLTESGAPLGITVSLSPVSVAAGATASTVDVGVDAAVAPGTYAITLSAAGTNVTTATGTLTVIVIQPGASGSVALSVTPPALTVTAGGPAATSQIEVARTAPFAGAVALTATVTGAPTGVTATIDPQSVAPGSTTATVSVQAAVGAAAGSTPIVIRATGTGVADATTTLNVTVNSGSGSGTTVTFCAADAPIWVATQDGSSGAWTRVTPTSGSTYDLSLPSGRGGIATVDTVGDGTFLNLTYGTTAEFTSYATGVSFFSGCSSKLVNGSVANVGVDQIASVSLGYSQAFVFPISSTTFRLGNVAEGPQDLVAVRRGAASLATDAIILRRDVDVPANGTLPVLDFNATEAFAPATGNVTVSNLGPDQGVVQTLFYGVAGSAFGILGSADQLTSTSGPTPYPAIPLARLEAGEVQLLTAFAGNRSAGRFFRTPADLTVVLGPTLSIPTVAKVAATPNARPRVQLASQAEYNRTVTALFSQTGLNRSVNLTATSGYFGGAPATWDLTVPDLSTVTGWDNAWGLQDGTGIDWIVSAQGGSIALFDPSITEGDTQQSATRSSSSPLLSVGRRPAR